MRRFKVVGRAGTLDELLDRVDADTADRIFEVKPLAPVLPLHPGLR